jgi:L-malate glycosyltransferase
MKEVKKLITVHLLNDFSGSPKVLSQVISGLKGEKFEVELFTSNNRKGFLTDLVKTNTFTYKHFNNKWLTLIAFMYSQFVLFVKLLKYWSKDITIYVNTMLPFGAALAGFVMRKPVIYHIHEISLSPKILKQFLRAIIKFTASKIIFVSKAVKESENFPRIPSKVIYNALPKSFEKENQGHDYTYSSEEVFNVLMLASLKEYKGVNEFLDLAIYFQTEKNFKFTLILNTSQQEINHWLADKAVPYNISVLPSQSEVFQFYNKAHLVLNLSHIDQWVETFGLTIIEAMAYGIPVIVPPVGGPAEIVSHGEEGFLVSAYDKAVLIKYIKQLQYNDALRTKMSENAKKRVTYFSEEKFNHQIYKFIHD